jgi:hypothetical protein
MASGLAKVWWSVEDCKRKERKQRNVVFAWVLADKFNIVEI